MQNHEILWINSTQKWNPGNYKFSWNVFDDFQKKTQVEHFWCVGFHYTAAEKAVATLPKIASSRKMLTSSKFVPLGVNFGISPQKCYFANFGCHLRSTCFFLRDYWWFWGGHIAFFAILHRNLRNAHLQRIFDFWAAFSDIWCILWISQSPRAQKSRKCYLFCLKQCSRLILAEKCTNWSKKSP